MSDRYEAIDLARGWALLGVAMVNVQALARGWTSHYALNLATTWYDLLAEYIVGVMFAHRAFPTLAFLLGVGLAYQWRSLSTATPTDAAQARSSMRARYVALLLLGIAHGLLVWPGDIVSAYALVVLLLFWKWPLSDRSLKRQIALFGTLLVLVHAASLWALSAWPALAEMDPTAPSFANPDWLSALRSHPAEYLSFGLVQFLIPEVWLAVLLGVQLGQSGRLDAWLRDPSKTSGLWLAVGVTSFVIGTALELAASRLGGWSYDLGAWPGAALLMLGLPLTAFGSVFLVLSVARAWSPQQLPGLRSLFVAAGRAPLTLFFGMSLLMVPIFHEACLGWHGDLGRAAYSLIAMATFFSLAAFSRAWLQSGHSRGPFELLWLRLASRSGKRFG
jgi:uncharacterized protein